MKTKVLPENRSKAIAEIAKAKTARRRRLSKRFRRELLRAIATTTGMPTLTFAQSTLTDACVSLRVEQSELSEAFFRGNATNSQMTRLGTVRGQLCRTLTLLGQVADDVQEPQDDATAPPANATPEERRAWSQRYVTETLKPKTVTP
jgi:hypothetical protein